MDHDHGDAKSGPPANYNGANTNTGYGGPPAYGGPQAYGAPPAHGAPNYQNQNGYNQPPQNDPRGAGLNYNSGPPDQYGNGYNNGGNA